MVPSKLTRCFVRFALSPFSSSCSSESILRKLLRPSSLWRRTWATAVPAATAAAYFSFKQEQQERQGQQEEQERQGQQEQKHQTDNRLESRTQQRNRILNFRFNSKHNISSNSSNSSSSNSSNSSNSINNSSSGRCITSNLNSLFSSFYSVLFYSGFSLVATEGAVGAAAAATATAGSKVAQCCGIIAYVGNRDVQPILAEGIQLLQNRGYDSCGMATIDDEGNIVTTKYASKGTTSDCVDQLLKEAPFRHSHHRIGIAHTRWATHGGKTDMNAHPHCDWKNRIAIVHNGTISNYSSIKDDLMKKGVCFKSETDTEVIANLIGVHLDEACELEVAVSRAVESLQGTWGLVVMHRDHQEQIICARNGSPMLVGGSDSAIFVASETLALSRYTNRFISLKDGEICVLNRTGVINLKASRDVLEIQNSVGYKSSNSPDPYLHWTLKEIMEQPESLSRALNYGGRIAPVKNRVKLGGLDENRESLIAVRHLVVCGCGTSLYAGMYGEKVFQALGCFDSVKVVDSSEIDCNSFPARHGGVLLLSQSGETLDTVRACNIAIDRNIKVFSIVNSVGSLLARTTNCGVYLNAGREVGVASTKCFSSQVLALVLTAAWFAQTRNISEEKCQVLMESVHRLPVYAGMTLSSRDKCKEIAMKLKNARTMFILGKGCCLPIAMEAALKIKEIAYTHAEGFPGGALKHGPFALLDEKEKTPVILLILAGADQHLMINAAEQVKARGAYLIILTDDSSSLPSSLAKEDLIEVPNVGALTSLLCVIPLQMLAYELAILKGINPDKPRGLAKTVTVN